MILDFEWKLMSVSLGLFLAVGHTSLPRLRQWVQLFLTLTHSAPEGVFFFFPLHLYVIISLYRQWLHCTCTFQNFRLCAIILHKTVALSVPASHNNGICVLIWNSHAYNYLKEHRCIEMSIHILDTRYWITKMLDNVKKRVLCDHSRYVEVNLDTNYGTVLKIYPSFQATCTEELKTT